MKSRALSLVLLVSASIAIGVGTAGCPKKPPKATPTPTPEASPTETRDDGSGVGGEGTPTPTPMLEADCLKPIYFDLDSSTLSGEGSAGLRAAVQCMTENPTWELSVEGHADERGGTQYNIALGERRARSVADYLVNAGVAKSRVTTVSFGEEKPANPGHDEVAWAQNRRVELRVSKR